MGRPKALVPGDGAVPWVVSAAATLRAGGCAEVFVAVGAERAAVRTLLAGTDHRVVDVPDWEDGIGASLRAGLDAVALTEAQWCLVHLVDLPDIGADVVRRVIGSAPRRGLARATFDGAPGHPVLLARGHWPTLLAEVRGDAGAGSYLTTHGAQAVECSDLATGADVDHPPAAQP